MLHLIFLVRLITLNSFHYCCYYLSIIATRFKPGYYVLRQQRGKSLYWSFESQIQTVKFFGQFVTLYSTRWLRCTQEIWILLTLNHLHMDMKNQSVPRKWIQDEIKTRPRSGTLVHMYSLVQDTYVYLWQSDSMQISTRTLSLAFSWLLLLFTSLWSVISQYVYNQLAMLAYM